MPNVALNLPEPIVRRLLDNCLSQLPESQSKVDAAKNELYAAQKEHDELLATTAQLEKALQLFSASSETAPSISDNSEPSTKVKDEEKAEPVPVNGIAYNKKWPILKRGIYIIYTANRALTTKEVVDTIVNQYEPEEKPNRARLVGNMSSVLGTAAKAKKLIKTVNDLGEFLYGLSEDFAANQYFIGQGVLEVIEHEKTKEPQTEQQAALTNYNT